MLGSTRGFVEYSIDIAAADQVAGENIISFVQNGKPAWKWGVTDLLLAEAAVTPPSTPYNITSYEVMLSFDGSGFDESRTLDPTIAIQDDIVHLFYSGLPFGNDVSVGLATSEDNQSFVRDSSEALIDNTGSTPFTENRSYVESVLYDAETNQWLMYFWGNQRNLATDPGYERGIGVATSPTS